MKLRRFGVVSSPDGTLPAWQRACLDGLDAAGCGRPAWAVASDRGVSPSWLWRVYVGRPFQGRRGEPKRLALHQRPFRGRRGEPERLALHQRDAPPDWWSRALLADRSPVDFVLCFAPPPAPIAPLDPPRFGIWRFEVDGGPTIGWRSATRGRHSVRATLVADAAGGRIVLQDGWLPVSLDYHATQRRLHDVLAGWPARAAAEIGSGGWGELTRSASHRNPQSEV